MKMKKQMKIVDVLASVLLVGVMSAMALAGPTPGPVPVNCPAFPVVLRSGATQTIPKYSCPAGATCGGWAELFDENNVSLGAIHVCLYPS